MPGGAVWYCYQRAPQCIGGHVLTFVRETKGMALQSAVSGHQLMACQKCRPTTFAFGIAALTGEPIITFYAVTKAQYSELYTGGLGADTIQILRWLGYAQGDTTDDEGATDGG